MRIRHAVILLAALAILGCENKKNEDVVMTNQAESVEAAGNYAQESAQGQKSFQNARNAAKAIEGQAADRENRAADALKEAGAGGQ